MNTGSRDEKQYLSDIGRIADALERIADRIDVLTKYVDSFPPRTPDDEPEELICIQ